MKKNYSTDDPKGNLISYMNGKMTLSEVFKRNIDPMLIPYSLKEKYSCEKLNGALQTAYWIDSGFGYCTVNKKDKEGLPVTELVDVFPPQSIMLDSGGFFNQRTNVCDFFIKKGSVMIPFTNRDFALLKESAPEAEALANKILADLLALNQEKARLIKLPGNAMLSAFVNLYSMEILQHFSQKDLASMLGITEVHFSNLKHEWLTN